MDSSLIELYRNKFINLKKQKQDMKDKLDRLEFLKEDSDVRAYEDLLNKESVKEYLELLRYCSDEHNTAILRETEEDLFKTVWEKLGYEIEDTNHIYVCRGKGYSGYKEMDGRYVICSSLPEEIRISLAYYKNLETWKDGAIIPCEECEEFERTHTVLPGIYSQEEYEMLSKQFIKEILEKGNEAATGSILTYKNH